MRDPEQGHRRLESLYEISKLFASFENVEPTFYRVVEIIVRTLPLRSAILVEGETGRSTMIVWPPGESQSDDMRAVKEHAEAAYDDLVALPRETATKASSSARFAVIPLAVARRPAFGACQLEGAGPFDETDVVFVNAIANQLAIALDRNRAWRRDITRRVSAELGRTEAEAKGASSEQARILAEEGRTDAEETGATAERERISAATASEKYAALAVENARLYQEAQQAVRVREQLLAIVSHDLRSPLTTIVMSANYLAEKGDAPQIVGRMQRAAKHMTRLIEDLLDFASIEAGRLAIRRQPRDPSSLIHDTLASFEGISQAKGLQLTADVEPHLPQVYCDGDRILQVLSNLVGNATKVTPDGGNIRLRAEGRGHEVLFAISDSGPGISAEDLAHLFERYWRSEESQYKGTGLGLAIAMGIVSAHGGRIWAESDLGQGATFLFTIPTADVTALFTVPTPDAGT